MINLTHRQIQALNADTRAKFAAILTAQLQKDYPELFAPLPFELAIRMVAGKIDYVGERYQIHFQSALATFLHFCCTIGPGFDHQGDIQTALDDLTQYPDDIPNQLPAIIRKQAWVDSERLSKRHHWFDSNKSDITDHIAARTCWALAEISRQRYIAQLNSNDSDLTDFIAQSVQAAEKHEITDPKGITAFAVCQSLWGNEFYKQHQKPWIAPIFNDPAIKPWLRSSALAGSVELEWNIEL